MPENKKQNGNDLLADVISWLKSFYYIIFYRVFYDNKEKAYYVKRREITYLILSPVFLPLFMLYGIVLYINWVLVYYERYLLSEKLKLTHTSMPRECGIRIVSRS
jgi:hypothetical protein